MAEEEKPRTEAEFAARVEHLEQVKEHREWVIAGLRDHVSNLEEIIARNDARVAGLEEHTVNVEALLEGLRRHTGNLERRVADRDQLLEALRAHVRNLERRLGRRDLRLSASGMFPSVRFARLDRLFRSGERIWNEREDLQQTYPPTRAADYWHWLLWHGVEAYPALREELYPAPDPHLMGRVVGEQMSPKTYFRSGLVNWQMIDDFLREGGFDPTRGGNLLDFGSGCGRILQFFALYAATVALHGADVDAEAVAWCTKHLDFARFDSLGPEPPSPFEARQFDAVFAFSVFSHLPEDLHLAWLEEIARITKPGAAVVLTTQGRHVVGELLDRRADEFPPPALLAKQLPELEGSGFAFFPYQKLRFRDPENVAHFEEWDLERYGSTFILEPYIRRRWTKLFDLVAHHAAPDDWQDYVVLRRRDGGP